MRVSEEFALNPGFAEGFLETTRAYFKQDSATSTSDTLAPTEHTGAPLPVIERGTGPRPLLHVLGPESA